jgi:hypothetical protein
MVLNATTDPAFCESDADCHGNGACSLSTMLCECAAGWDTIKSCGRLDQNDSCQFCTDDAASYNDASCCPFSFAATGCCFKAATPGCSTASEDLFIKYGVILGLGLLCLASIKVFLSGRHEDMPLEPIDEDRAASGASSSAGIANDALPALSGGGDATAKSDSMDLQEPLVDRRTGSEAPAEAFERRPVDEAYRAGIKGKVLRSWLGIPLTDRQFGVLSLLSHLTSKYLMVVGLQSGEGKFTLFTPNLISSSHAGAPIAYGIDCACAQFSPAGQAPVPPTDWWYGPPSTWGQRRGQDGGNSSRAVPPGCGTIQQLCSYQYLGADSKVFLMALVIELWIGCYFFRKVGRLAFVLVVQECTLEVTTRP